MADSNQLLFKITADVSQLKSATNDANNAVSGMGAAAARASESVKGWEQSLNQAEAAEKKLTGQTAFLDSLKKQADAIGKTRAELFEMQAAHLGVAERAAPLISRLRESEAGMNRVGLSAAQMQAALRGVPAQFTDIVVSLQGGQAPMTVLMQQGGQLKDMFGGVGNAAKALGGYVASLVSPLTVTAAAAVAIGAAYRQGSEEAKEFAKSLILSGNAAGTSVNQLQNMAASVAAATGATKGAAAAALNEIAASGKVAAGGIEQVAAASIAMERATGTAVSDTVEQFAELGKSPVEASKKLNDQYGYLTAAVYQQIKALEDNGKTAEAAAVAQAAYASAIIDKTDKIKQSLGLLETGWKAVGDGAKAAWDKMLSVGRGSTLEEQIANQVKYIQGLRGGPFAVDTTKAENYLTQLQIQLEKTKKLAFEEGERARVQKEGVAAVDAVTKANEKALSKREKMNKALADYRENIEKVRAADPSSSLLEMAKIAKAEASIRESFKTSSADGSKNDAAQAFAAEIKAGQDNAKTAVEIIQEKVRQQVLTEREGVEQTLAVQQQGFVEQAKLLRARLAAVGDKGEQEKLRAQIVTLGNDAAVAAEKAVSGIAKIDAEARKENEKALKSLQDEAIALTAKADAAEQENAQIGLSGDALAALTQQRYNERLELLQDKAAAIEALAGRTAEVEAIEQQINAMQRLKNAEIARPKLREQAREWEKFSDDIQRSLTDALYRSFESGEGFGKSFAKNLENTFKSMVLKFAIQSTMTTGGNLLNSAINYVAGSGGENGGAGTNYLGLASNANSIYNLAGGTYLGYWQAAQAGASLTSTEAAAAAQAYYQAGYYGTGASIQAGAAVGSGSVAAGEAGTASAGGSLGSTGGGLSAGAYTGIGLIIAGMLMSSAAWKSGIRADGNWSKGSDPGSWDMAIWDLMYKSTNDITSEDFGKKAGIDAYISGKVATALFGDNIGGSEGFAVVFGSSLSKQVSDYLKTATGNNGAPKTNVSTHFTASAAGGVTNTPLNNGSTAYAGGQETLAAAIFNPAIALAATRFAARDLFDVTLAGHINNQGRSKNQKLANVTQGGETIYNVRSESGKGMGDFESFASDQIPRMQMAIIAEAMRDSSADYKAVVDLVLGTSTDLSAAIGQLSQYDIANTLTTLFGMADGFDQFKASLGGMVISFVDLSATAVAARESAVAQKTAAEEQLSRASAAGDSAAVEALKTQISALTTAAAEKTVDAVARVMNETSAVQGVIEVMGKSLSDVFSAATASKLFSISDSLVQMFGGIDAMNTSFNAYHDNFYSSTEKTNRQWELMQRQFDGLSLTMPRTREGFRDLVDGLDLTSAGGQQAFKSLMDLQGAFAGLTPVVEDAAAAVRAAAEAAASAEDGYHKNFYSGAEKTNRQWELMQRQFDGLGLTMPKTREGFRDLVDGLDLTSSGGRAARDALMLLQGGFADLTPTMDDAAAAARAEADAAAEAAAARLSAAAASASDALSLSRSATDSAQVALEVAISKQKTAAQATVDAASEQISAIDSLFSVLESNIAELRGTTVQSYAGAMAELERMLATAQGSGYMPESSELSKIVGAARAGMDQKAYASSFDAQKDRMVLAGKLNDLHGVLDAQKSVAERQLHAVEDQLSTLDELLRAGKSEVGALRGVDNSVLSVADAVQSLQSALVTELRALDASIFASLAAGQVGPQQAVSDLESAGATIAKDSWSTVETTSGDRRVWASSLGATIAENVVYATNGYVGSLEDAKALVTDYYNQESPSQFVAAAKSVGLSAATIDTMYGFSEGTTNAWAEANNLPKFAVGTNYVQQDMIAQIHEGEAIIPKAFNPWAGVGQSRDSTTAAEIKLLKAEVVRLQGLIAESNAHARRTANAVNGNPEAPILVEVAA